MSSPTTTENASGLDEEVTDAFVDHFTDLDKSEQRRHLQEMSADQLQEMKLHLQERIDDIEAQLQDARQRAAKEGEYADQDWFNSAQYAKKAMGRTIQYIQMLQSRRPSPQQPSADPGSVPEGSFKEALRKIDGLTWKQFFVEEAKDRLDEETYMEIARAAGERAERVVPEGLRRL